MSLATLPPGVKLTMMLLGIPHTALHRNASRHRDTTCPRYAIRCDAARRDAMLRHDTPQYRQAHCHSP